MTGDHSDNMNYWVDFYSNDHQKDLSVEAELVSYGLVETKLRGDFIMEDPEFDIKVACDSEDNIYELTEEEQRRVTEILNNLYWNETLY